MNRKRINGSINNKRFYDFWDILRLGLAVPEQMATYQMATYIETRGHLAYNDRFGRLVILGRHAIKLLSAPVVRPHPSVERYGGTPNCIGGGTTGMRVNESGLPPRLNEWPERETWPRHAGQQPGCAAFSTALPRDIDARRLKAFETETPATPGIYPSEGGWSRISTAFGSDTECVLVFR